MTLLLPTFRNGVMISSNVYDVAGRLTSVTAVAAVYDRRGRKTSVTNGTDVCNYTYNDAGQLLTETFPLAGVTITNAYDSLLRRSQLSVLGSQSPVSYTYDAASRLQSVSDGTRAATYSYLANSPLVSNITFQTGTITRMSTTKTYDSLNRLLAISHLPAAGNPINFAYLYNAANQRTRRTDADGSYWDYTYDALGQVTSGHKKWADTTPVARQQYGYEFDDIGNRKQSGIGVPPVQSVYTANSLNQYTQRTVPGTVWELGSAASNATVTINNQPVARQGKYFAGEITVNNASSAVYTQLTTVAVLKNAGSNQMDIVSSVTGKVFVAKSPELFGYDADGNLTNDGRFAYTWDAENRLIGMETLPNLPASVPRQKLLFGYDHQSRRISKVVSNWTGSSWEVISNLKFVYDQWNLVAELDSTNALVRSYVWGFDLSGSEQGAGGVGGLLFIGNRSSVIGDYAAAFDGNGNVTALVDMNGGALAAAYEYGPFGELLRKTDVASVCPFRFSTKYRDDETGLLYYGYRYLGKQGWPSRDPLQERASDNLYIFPHNDAINLVDYLGLKPPCSECDTPVNAISAAPDAPAVKGGDKIAGEHAGNVGKLITHVAAQVGPKQCLSRLTIIAHGNPDIVDIGGQPNYSPPASTGIRIGGDVEIDSQNARRVGERIRDIICVCKSCEVYILSCNVALGTIAQELANGSRCKVYAANGYCFPNRTDPGNSNIQPKTRNYPPYPGAGDQFITFNPQP